MKRRRSALAKASLLFGLIAIFLVLIRAPFSLFLAIPVGGVAVCLGAAGVWSTSRNRQLPGFRMALFGAVTGAIAGLFGVLLFAQITTNQLSHNRSRREHMQTMEQLHARSSIQDAPAAKFTSDLPIITMEIIERQEDGTVVRAKFFEPEGGKASIAAESAYEGLATINVRGHSTREFPKRSYTMHMVDDTRTNQINVALLGLPAEEDWVLYAPFEDKSLIRDVLAYDLARKMGHYAPRTRYVELFLKRGSGAISTRDYMGIYVLVERIKRGKDRVKIAKLEPQDTAEPDITGGYIIKRDHREGDGSRFNTSHGGPYFFVYPKSRSITAEQKRWIRNHFNQFEEALYGEDFADSQTGYAAYLDVNGFIDSHWLIELSKNVDGFRYSSYITKDRGGKLKPGPAWDWNRAFGNANYYGGGQTRGWYWSVLRPNEISWHRRLREDPAYLRLAGNRWRELRKDVFDPAKIGAMIDQYAAQLDQAQQRNFERWPILGEHVASNSFVGSSYREEVEWLKKWITARIAWIDKQVATGNNF